MADQPFKPGDIVQLKSGGPKMTVERKDGFRISLPGEADKVDCQWFVGNKLQHGSFYPESLKAVE
ncbi:DUF2158 domain-containing protein [Hymenobacter gummosus]|uniref:DUF2158 domain-containing protein n=1 Tax=Hymenobacter gummosus TaxID=1776032 RepID=A0A3S0IQW8_9BACT|nr:DUF2158 domain-containing protein [Hymenobacter gummosus]RTQ52312.1 DUF2158 domain-containing protein [Hymenobacter gummosus]